MKVFLAPVHIEVAYSTTPLRLKRREVQKPTNKEFNNIIDSHEEILSNINLSDSLL